MRQYYLYFMASKKNGTLYCGMTNVLEKRIWEHKNDQYDGFTKRYSVHKLVYYEIYGSAYEAIKREKRLKGWKRDWKMDLINKSNPDWRDLYTDNNEILPLPATP